MSEFIMTMDEASDYASSSSEDEAAIAFEWTDNSLESSMKGGKTHAWNFDAARENLREKEKPKRTVDDIIKNELAQQANKKKKIADSDSEDSEDNSMDVDDEEFVSDGSENSESEEVSGDSDEEGSGSEDEASDDSDDDSGDEVDGHDGSGDEDVVLGSDSEQEEDEEEGMKRAEKESLHELRDITRKATKKQMELVNQLTDMASFDQLKLSRPLLKALIEMGFTKPTPIQVNCIPMALKGRDICASALTGSGKTAAFILPVLERLLYRNKSAQVTRVLIMTPTRELAVQCHSVITNLAKYTNGISAALVTGGMSTKKQEEELRNSPDIIVATPGRVLDHLLNTRAFDLGDIEILVLDEADRLLELGFQDQLEQVVQSCPKSRQTMLFSATMTEKVDQLASLSLDNPAQINVDPLFQVARKLTQEFIRVRSGTDIDKEAILLSICSRTFKSKVIIFCSHKLTAHRLKIIFTIAGLNAVELHGDLTQSERFDSLEAFRDGKADFLIASDVASRGLDIVGVDTVINFELPLHLSSYVHRVGRTARAGRSGRAVSLITEGDRRLFKMVVKNSHHSVKQRIVPAKSLLQWKDKLQAMRPTIKNVYDEEGANKLLLQAEMEANRAANKLEHHDAIMARPKKTWIQTAAEEKQAKKAAVQEFLQKGQKEGEASEKKEDAKKKDKKNKKKRGHHETFDSGYSLDIEYSSSRAKKRKVTEQDKKDLIVQKAIIRQKRREPTGRAAPAQPTNATHRIGARSKTSAVKLRNKASGKSGKPAAAAGPSPKTFAKNSWFSQEASTSGKKKTGFKSNKRFKRH